MHPAATDRFTEVAREEPRAAATTLTARARLGAVALAVAGILFVLYPAIRPFSSEVGLDGAAAFGSSNWIAAHMLAMVGFALLAVGLLCWYATLARQPVAGRAFWALAVTVLGIALSLPFYGGEAFGLHAIGQRALRQHNPDLVGLAGTVRGGAGLILFLTGLLVLAVGTILVAITTWKSRNYARWSGVPLALAFGLYIPQFFGTQPLRVAHGLLVTLGCGWLAVELWRHGHDA
ncbi:MAG TPA: hypothetical protein VFW96_25075 [Thermomicrobiales bacterium]|nr:hypothetical protein [Thermomicrobiales bacterium]